MTARLAIWILALGLIAASGLAQENRPATQPTSRPTEANPIYENLTLDNMSIDDLAEFLTRTSSVDYQVYRDPGLVAGLPRFERLYFRRVSANELIDAVKAVFSDTRMTVENIKPIQSLFSPNAPTRDEGHTTIFHVTAYGLNSPEVKVYALPLGLPSINDSLSLIQAAVDQYHGPKAVLSVHEPTRTLIVNANAWQQQIVQNSVDALANRSENRRDALDVIEEIKRMQEELKSRMVQQPTTQTSSNPR